MINFKKAIELSVAIPSSAEDLQLARMCSQFGQRPSEYKNIQDQVEALAYDLACSRMLETEKSRHIQDSINSYNSRYGHLGKIKSQV